jgi:plasmid stabilization system protein ParE
MQVRWTSVAADDLENIANYLFEKAPENAPRLIREICDAPSSLKNFPNLGRAGKKKGTRELPMSSPPYASSIKSVATVCISFASCTARKTGHDEGRFQNLSVHQGLST